MASQDVTRGAAAATGGDEPGLDPQRLEALRREAELVNDEFIQAASAAYLALLAGDEDGAKELLVELIDGLRTYSQTRMAPVLEGRQIEPGDLARRTER